MYARALSSHRRARGPLRSLSPTAVQLCTVQPRTSSFSPFLSLDSCTKKDVFRTVLHVGRDRDAVRSPSLCPLCHTQHQTGSTHPAPSDSEWRMLLLNPELRCLCHGIAFGTQRSRKAHARHPSCHDYKLSSISAALPPCPLLSNRAALIFASGMSGKRWIRSAIRFCHVAALAFATNLRTRSVYSCNKGCDLPSAAARIRPRTGSFARAAALRGGVGVAAGAATGLTPPIR